MDTTNPFKPQTDASLHWHAYCIILQDLKKNYDTLKACERDVEAEVMLYVTDLIHRELKSIRDESVRRAEQKAGWDPNP
jgi:hypothetical protein